MRQIFYALLLGSLSLSAADASAATYTVRKGDTLFSVARAHDVTLTRLLESNPGVKATALQVGQRLVIPDKAAAGADIHAQDGVTVSGSNATPAPPTVSGSAATPVAHVVKKGDTLSAVARQYNVTVSDLMAWNKLASTQINIGQKLTVSAPPPVVNSATTATVSVSATASGTLTVSGSAKPPPPPVTPPVIRAAPEKYWFINSVKKQLDAPKISRQWKYIVAHHSGSTRGNAAIFEYDHRQRGMENGLAYHFVIGNGTDSGDGEIEVGGRWRRQIKGGHLRTELTENGVELNEIAIGICLVGDFEKSRPTRKQIAALIELTNYLNGRVSAAGYARPKFSVHGDMHPQHTDCPGKNFPKAALYKLFGTNPNKAGKER